MTKEEQLAAIADLKGKASDWHELLKKTVDAILEDDNSGKSCELVLHARKGYAFEPLCDFLDEIEEYLKGATTFDDNMTTFDGKDTAFDIEK